MIEGLSAQNGQTDFKDYGVNVLFQPEDAKEAAADIVLVHGLTGGPRKTWYHGASSTFWPAELLACDVPRARIMTWGYDADVASFWGHASQNRLGDHARNLLGDLGGVRDDANTVRASWCDETSAFVFF